MLKSRLTDVVAIVILCLVVAIFFGAMSEKQIDYGLFDDFRKHIGDAENLITSNWRPPFPHFLHHAIKGIIAGGEVDNLRRATTIAHILYYEVMALVIYAILRPLFAVRLRSEQAILLVGAVLSLTIIMPINLLTPRDTLTLYFGYIVPSPYHNPTTILMKMFAVLQLPLAIRIFHVRDKLASLPFVALTLMVTVLALIGKPNFTLSMLPVLVLLAVAWQFLLRRRVDWRLLLAGFVIPALPVLWWQYTMAFDTNSDVSGGIVFAPLQFFLLVEPDTVAIFLKLLLSSLFPLAVLVMYPRKVIQHTPLILVWGIYGAALAQAYLFNQSGPQFNHGNFVWGAFVALFVLFVYSLAFFIAQNQQANGRDTRFYIGTGIYLLHVLAGLFWFWINLTILYPGTGDPVMCFLPGQC